MMKNVLIIHHCIHCFSATREHITRFNKNRTGYRVTENSRISASSINATSCTDTAAFSLGS